MIYKIKVPVYRYYTRITWDHNLKKVVDKRYPIFTHNEVLTFNSATALIEYMHGYTPPWSERDPYRSLMFRVRRREVTDEYDLPVTWETIQAQYLKEPRRVIKAWVVSGRKINHNHQPGPHTFQEIRANEAAEREDGVHIRGKRQSYNLPNSWDHRHTSWGRRNWKHFRKHQYHVKETES